MNKISKLFTLPMSVLKAWIPLYKSSITNLHQFHCSACSSDWALLHVPMHGLKRGPTGQPSELEGAGLAMLQNRVSGHSQNLLLCYHSSYLRIAGTVKCGTSLVYPDLSYGQLYSKANRFSKVYCHMLHQFMERRDKYTLWLMF